METEAGPALPRGILADSDWWAFSRTCSPDPAPLATRQARTEPGARSTTTSLPADTKSCSRRTRLWISASARAPPGEHRQCRTRSLLRALANKKQPVRLERVNPGHASPNNQRMNIMRALIRLHRLQIHQMPHDRVIISHAVGPQNIP